MGARPELRDVRSSLGQAGGLVSELITLAGLDARAQAFVALPGGYGTLEELTEILSFRKLGLHHRLLVLLDADDFYDGLGTQIERAVAEGFDSAEARDYFRVARAARGAVDLCEASLRG